MHFQHIILKSFSMTAVANQVNIGHKLHFHFDFSFALAFLTSAAINIK